MLFEVAFCCYDDPSKLQFEVTDVMWLWLKLDFFSLWFCKKNSVHCGLQWNEESDVKLITKLCNNECNEEEEKREEWKDKLMWHRH